MYRWSGNKIKLCGLMLTNCILDWHCHRGDRHPRRMDGSGRWSWEHSQVCLSNQQRCHHCLEWVSSLAVLCSVTYLISFLAAFLACKNYFVFCTRYFALTANHKRVLWDLGVKLLLTHISSSYTKCAVSSSLTQCVSYQEHIRTSG